MRGETLPASAGLPDWRETVSSNERVLLQAIRGAECSNYSRTIAEEPYQLHESYSSATGSAEPM